MDDSAVAGDSTPGPTNPYMHRAIVRIIAAGLVVVFACVEVLVKEYCPAVEQDDLEAGLQRTVESGVVSKTD